MKSVFGLNQNAAAALSYIFGPFSGVLVLALENENKFVRFHALQSTIYFVILWLSIMIVDLIAGMFGLLPVIGGFLGGLISIVSIIGAIISLISLIILIVKALNGETFKIPMLGDIVWAQVAK